MIKNVLHWNKGDLNSFHYSSWPAMPAPHCLPTVPCPHPKYLNSCSFLSIQGSSSRWQLLRVLAGSSWGLARSSQPCPALLLLRLCLSVRLSFLPAPSLQVEVVSPRAGEQRRKKRIYTLVFWKLESREKLKNVTWGQDVWLCSYRAERGRFAPIATPWPVSWRNFPTSWMCGGFRGTSPPLICFLQLCGRKVITEESAALQETRVRWSCVWSWELFLGHPEVTAPPATVLLNHPSMPSFQQNHPLQLLIWLLFHLFQLLS